MRTLSADRSPKKRPVFSNPMKPFWSAYSPLTAIYPAVLRAARGRAGGGGGGGAGVGPHLGPREPAAGPEAALPQEVEQLAIGLGLLRDALHHERLALRRLRELDRVVRLGLGHARDGIAVRTGRGHPEHLGQALLDDGGERVLEPVRLVVGPRPVETADIGQPALEQAGATRHRAR